MDEINETGVGNNGNSKEEIRSQDHIPPDGTYNTNQQDGNYSPPPQGGQYTNQQGGNYSPPPQGTYYTNQQSGYYANQGNPTATTANQYQYYREQDIPQEVSRWNWGAFMFSWVWGCANGAFLTLLTFIPLFNIVWIFVCGALGNKWAWKSGKFKDLETFLAVQKTWNIAGIIMFCISIAIIAIYIVVIVFFASFLGSNYMLDRYADFSYY